jgi:hypothetical protein
LANFAELLLIEAFDMQIGVKEISVSGIEMEIGSKVFPFAVRHFSLS